MTELVIFETRLSTILETFKEAMAHRELSYRLSGLKRYGFEDDHEIHFAVERAIRLCRALGVDPKNHFGHFYKVDLQTREAIKEWKASKLGFYLTMCNGRIDNPFTGALQIEMLRSFLSKLE